MSTATTEEPVSEQQAGVLALFEKVSKGHHDKDAATIVSAYAPDAVVFNLAPPLRSQMMSDAAPVKAWLDTWDGPIERNASNFEIQIKEPLAICHGYYRLIGTPKSAGRQISFWMRATVVLSNEPGEWLIVHEHTSVPFYMDGSLRPAFDLEP